MKSLALVAAFSALLVGSASAQLAKVENRWLFLMKTDLGAAPGPAMTFGQKAAAAARHHAAVAVLGPAYYECFSYEQVGP